MTKKTTNSGIDRKDIPQKTALRLWARAAGRCEICNKLLHTDEYTQNNVNAGQIAHIVAAKENGPRGESGKTADERNNIDNLMLLCYTHHQLVDKERSDVYTVERLISMKKEHEDRIRLVTSVCPNKKSLVILYGPSIGKDRLCPSFDDAAMLLFPRYNPAEGSPLRIEAQNVTAYDDESLYWQLECKQLDDKLKREMDNLLDKGVIHFSVFALAPQPLLVKLGTILNDKYSVEVYQKHREPDTWAWPEDVSTIDNKLRVEKPQDKSLSPVLVFALSASAIRRRILDDLSDTHSVWVVTCNEPNNDILKEKGQLADFRKCVRPLLDEIKYATNYDTIDVYMAMPAAFAVELGRVRMPKADLKFRLFDYQKGKDVETIIIE